MYGFSKAEALGKVSHALLQTQFPDPSEAIEAKLLQVGRWEGKLVHIKRDGTPIIVATRWALKTDEYKHPSG
jgi:hypothetical protein